jgi:plastocyanin
MRIVGGLAAICLVLAMAAACGDGSKPVPGVTMTIDADGAEVGLITVSMRDNVFVPATFRVPLGLPVRVTAVNDGVEVHNMLVEGEDGDTAFLSDVRVSAGESSTFEVVFDAPGSYRFSCGFHLPGMVGTISVE